MTTLQRFAVTLTAVLAVSACSTTQAPRETADGLVLQPGAKFQEVYLLPDADLSQYEHVGVSDCSVAFRRNWLRDQNNSRIDLSNRVTQQDVDRIKDSLGELCTSAFREALLKDPAYALVDEFDNGEAVLVVQPAIVNLDINAPDTRSAGMTRSYTTSSGEMTLRLELIDATTGQVLARVMDRRREMDTGRLQWSNSVTNRADAQRALNRWAGMMREGLDRATAR